MNIESVGGKEFQLRIDHVTGFGTSDGHNSRDALRDLPDSDKYCVFDSERKLPPEDENAEFEPDLRISLLESAFGETANEQSRKKTLRTLASSTGLVNLAISLKNTGQSQPIHVRKENDENYKLLAGCRRILAVTYLWLANGAKGHPPVLAAKEVEHKGDKADNLAFDDNAHNLSLTEVEKGRHYQFLAKSKGLNNKQIAEHLGMKPSAAQTIRKRRTLAQYVTPMEESKLNEGELNITSLTQKCEDRAGIRRSNSKTTVREKPGGRTRSRTQKELKILHDDPNAVATLIKRWSAADNNNNVILVRRAIAYAANIRYNPNPRPVQEENEEE